MSLITRIWILRGNTPQIDEDPGQNRTVIGRLCVRSLLAGFCLALAIGSGSAMASTAVELSLDSLVHDSKLILQGKVITTESMWQGGSARDATGPVGPGGRIVTKVQVEVEEVWKQSEGMDEPDIQDRHVVELIIPGGLVDGIGQWVPGAPKLVKGERHILFLGSGPVVSGHRFVSPLGLSQGVFRIVTGAEADAGTRAGVAGAPGMDTHTEWVVRDLAGLRLVRPVEAEDGPGAAPRSAGKYVAKNVATPPLPTSSQSSAITMVEFRQQVSKILMGRAPTAPSSGSPTGIMTLDGGSHASH